VYVRVCNDKWRTAGEFERVAYLIDATQKNMAEVEALKSLMMLLDQNMTYEEASNFSTCQASSKGKRVFLYRPNTDITISWMVLCPQNGPVTSLQYTLFKGPYKKDNINVDLDERLTTLLLTFKSLRDLDIIINAGQLSPQLGSLRNLENVHIYHNCLTGVL
jgi:hypothetical protein